MSSFIKAAGLTCLSALALLATSSLADDASRSKEIQDRFAKCDTNRDGRLTLDEAKGCMPRVYDHFFMD